MITFRYFKQLFCGLIIGFIVCSCGNKQNVAGELNFDFPEEKLPYTISFSHIIDDSSRILPDNIVNQILRNLKKHEGISAKIQTPLPETWVVEYKLTPMSSDFDIWVVSNFGDVTHKILATDRKSVV